MKIVPLCALVTFSVLVLLLHATVAEKRALRLQVTPLVSFAPATLAVQVRVQVDPDDRWISVGTDNGEFRRVSGFTISQERSFYMIDWREVPAGDYVVVAAIGHGDVTRAEESVRVTVIARF